MTSAVLAALLAFAPPAPQWTGAGDHGDFVIIRDGIRAHTHTIAHYKAADAYGEIVKNLVRFRDIRRKVQEAERVDDVIDDITAGLEAIATSYSHIASMQDDILGRHASEMKSLGGLNENTAAVTSGIRERRATHEQEIASLERALETEKDAVERRKAEVSIRSLKSQINSLNAKERIWQKFGEAQAKLLERLQTNRKNLDLLLHVLRENAKVYKSAASVARLRKSARHALKQLVGLADLQAVLGDLEASWREVDGLVNEISTADFDLDLNDGPGRVDAAK